MQRAAIIGPRGGSGAQAPSSEAASSGGGESGERANWAFADSERASHTASETRRPSREDADPTRSQVLHAGTPATGSQAASEQGSLHKQVTPNAILEFQAVAHQMTMTKYCRSRNILLSNLNNHITASGHITDTGATFLSLRKIKFSRTPHVAAANSSAIFKPRADYKSIHPHMVENFRNSPANTTLVDYCRAANINRNALNRYIKGDRTLTETGVRFLAKASGEIKQPFANKASRHKAAITPALIEAFQSVAPTTELATFIRKHNVKDGLKHYVRASGQLSRAGELFMARANRVVAAETSPARDPSPIGQQALSRDRREPALMGKDSFDFNQTLQQRGQEFDAINQTGLGTWGVQAGGRADQASNRNQAGFAGDGAPGNKQGASGHSVADAPVRETLALSASRPAGSTTSGLVSLQRTGHRPGLLAHATTPTLPPRPTMATATGALLEVAATVPGFPRVNENTLHELIAHINFEWQSRYSALFEPCGATSVGEVTRQLLSTTASPEFKQRARIALVSAVEDWNAASSSP